MGNFANGPSLEDLQGASVNRPGQMERNRQSLYDTVVYATAGANQLSFFANPIGQGLSASPGNANNPKSKADTNMVLAGQLPTGQNGYIESVEVEFLPGSSATANTFALVNPIVFAVAASAGTVFGAASDVSAIYNTGFLEIVVGSKPYLTEAPLGKFPPKAHREIDAAVATTSATVGQTAIQCAKAVGRPYFIDPIRLINGQNFAVTVGFPVVVATPSGFNGSMRVTLDGWIFRNSQ